MIKKVLQFISSLKSFFREAKEFKKDIKGTDNIIRINKSARLIKTTCKIKGNNNSIIVEDSVVLKNVNIFIKGSKNKILISKNVKFNRGGNLWIEDYDCEIFIDEKTTFEDVHIAVTEPNSKVHIGKDCMFAYDIDIRTGDSHSIIDNLSKKRINFAESVCIGDHVWIAPQVSILKGVRILNNSIISTKSLVTKAFNTSNVLIGGIPASIIKENVDWDRRRIY